MFCQLRAILIDLSGTIHIGQEEIAGSIEALTRLKRSGLRYKFVTNTTKESQKALFTRLQSIGFDIGSPNEIFTSLISARDFLKREQLKPIEPLLLEDDALNDFESVLNDTNNQNENNKSAVIVGLAPSKFNYETLNIHLNSLLNGSRLIAIHQGRYFKTENGLALGPGPFVRALAYGADIKPEDIVTVGKPNRDFFLSAIKSLGEDLKPEECLMIGDDVRDDIEGAMACGLQGILVKTGKYRDGDEDKIDPKPTMVFSSFNEAIETILCDWCN